MIIEDNNICGNCDYFQSNKRECRLEPPKHTEGFTRASFPKVHVDDWCGKHNRSKDPITVSQHD